MELGSELWRMSTATAVTLQQARGRVLAEVTLSHPGGWPCRAARVSRRHKLHRAVGLDISTDSGLAAQLPPPLQAPGSMPT